MITNNGRNPVAMQRSLFKLLMPREIVYRMPYFFEKNDKKKSLMETIPLGYVYRNYPGKANNFDIIIYTDDDDRVDGDFSLAIND